MNPKNYDVWFDYARLEESVGDVVRIREVYERALSQVPPLLEKRFWRRYIYIWIFYAIWEETVAKVKKKKSGCHLVILLTLSKKKKRIWIEPRKSTLNVSK